jgi:hypothetical protein
VGSSSCLIRFFCPSAVAVPRHLGESVIRRVVRQLLIIRLSTDMPCKKGMEKRSCSFGLWPHPASSPNCLNGEYLRFARYDAMPPA